MWWWHGTTATVKDLEGNQKTVAGPTRGGWASPRFGELVMEPMDTGRCRHGVLRLGRLEDLLFCHRGGEMGLTENNFLLIKRRVLNITHTYNF